MGPDDRRPGDGRSDGEEDGSGAGGPEDLFADPPGYYPPSPPPTTEQHALGRSGVQLTLHLVGHSVLEAHRLWNGSRVLADYLEEGEAAAGAAEDAGGNAAADTEAAAAAHSIRGRHPVRGKTVLELGAGAALPGIVCGWVLGARKVVVTDYPDPELVATMRRNIAECETAAAAAAAAGKSGAAGTDTTAPTPAAYAGPGTVVADGYVWGADPAPILAHLDDVDGVEDGTDAAERQRFDVVLLADLLFRHAEHAKLAYSVAQTLKRTSESRAYVFFTSYRPWLRHKDLAFFGHARDAGLVVEHLLEKRLEKPPLFFENDPGDAGVRSTVSGYALRWPATGEDPRAFWPPPGGIVGEDEVPAAEMDT